MAKIVTENSESTIATEKYVDDKLAELELDGNGEGTLYDDTEIRAELENKVDKEDGKGLSSNNFTGEEKDKLESLQNYDDNQLREELENKVDKEDGKGLSSNDFTDEERDKLESLQNYDDSELHAGIDAAESAIDTIDSKIPNQYGGVEQANGHRGGYWITDQNFNIIGSNVVAIVSWWYTDTQTEETYNRVLPNATENNPGMQSAEDVRALHKCQTDIIALNGNTTYLDEYDFGDDRPTDEALTEYAQEQKGDLYNGNYHYSVVNSASSIEYIANGDGTWAEFGNSNVNIATNDTAGIIQGDATTAYKVKMESDGTASVNQLQELAANVSTVEGHVQSLSQSKANTASLADVAISGSYNDLSNKPTIPTIPVTSVAGKTGAVTLTKADVSLSNVDNTADANKPLSNAMIGFVRDVNCYGTITWLSITQLQIQATFQIGDYSTTIPIIAASGQTVPLDSTDPISYSTTGIFSSVPNNRWIIWRPGTGWCSCSFTSGSRPLLKPTDVVILRKNGIHWYLWNDIEINEKQPVLSYGYLEDVTKASLTALDTKVTKTTNRLFYVDSAGTDDAAHGTSSGSGAWKTLDYALLQLKSLSVINLQPILLYLADGQTFSSSTANGVGSGFYIIGNAANMPTIASTGIITITQANIRFLNIIFSGHLNTAGNVLLETSYSTITFIGCIFNDTVNRTVANISNNSSMLDFQSCTFNTISNYAIRLYGGYTHINSLNTINGVTVNSVHNNNGILFCDTEIAGTPGIGGSQSPRSVQRSLGHYRN